MAQDMAAATGFQLYETPGQPEGLDVKNLSIAIAALLMGCVVAPPARVYLPPDQGVIYEEPAPQAVISVYVDPPLYQPPPVRVQWAPPPMLVEFVPPQPYPGAFWTGGYWVWEGNWVWAHGRWASPPRPGYGWVNPYYEHRGDSVVFISGFWAAPGVVFERPSPSINIAFATVAAGIVAGHRPIGPEGVFVPPPPGSRHGLIVPAPVGTAPAVVVSAPPVINEGMRIHANNNSNNTSTINNVANVTNVTNVTVVAPASATANGQAVNKFVPAQAHIAAALPPVVRVQAPEPASSKAIPASAAVPGRAPVALPPAQTSASPALHPRNQGSEPVRGQQQGQPQEPSQEQDRRIRAEQRAATMRNMPVPVPQPQLHPQPQLQSQPQLQQHPVVPLRENVQAPPRPVQRPNAEREKSREANQPKEEEKRMERKGREHE